jgi:UDP-glucose 6-dehydrogenase
LSILIPIAVVVPMVIAALVLAIIGIGYVTIKTKTRRKQKLSAEIFCEKGQSQVRTVEYDGPPVEEEEIGDTMLQMHNSALRATQNDTDNVTNFKVAVTELPPPNTRISIIEPDSGVFSHLDSADSSNV